jgi:hypothetical protein
MPAQPHMTYSQQHAAAKLIPKGPDIENAARSPDSLLAFVNMFRDIEAPDDSPDAVTTRETFCEDFYFVDEPEEIKNAAIHISMVLTSLAANVNAMYQPHSTFGEQLRASILFRASLVFDYALPSQGLVIQRAQAAFHNFNTASSVFADMTDADQISDALTVQRDALQANLTAELTVADDELHESTLAQSDLLKPILDTDIFLDTQDLLREVCSYLSQNFAITFNVTSTEADTLLTEMLTMAGFKNSDTPFESDSTKFSVTHTIAVRLMVRQRKLFKKNGVAYPKNSKLIDQLANCYLCKHAGDPIDKQEATSLLAEAYGLYSSSASEQPHDHHFFLIAYFKHKGVQDPALRRGVNKVLHGQAVTLSPRDFLQALELPTDNGDKATPRSSTGLYCAIVRSPPTALTPPASRLLQ